MRTDIVVYCHTSIKLMGREDMLIGEESTLLFLLLEVFRINGF